MRRSESHLLHVAVAVVMAIACAVPAAAVGPSLDPVLYRIAMPDPSSHLFEVTVTATAEGGPVTFQMPAWSPGRYVVYDFARNVQDVRASDGGGRELPVEKLDKQTWRVAPSGAAGRVVFSYRVYADNLSGTFSQLDERHGNFNGASVFVYVADRKPAPVRLEVVPPPGWKVYNAETVSPDQRAFEFANYDLLIDTPTEIAPDFEVATFRVDDCEYRVLTHQFGGARAATRRYAADTERIVRAQAAILGVPPDLPRYTFIAHFAPGNVGGGDGMEHLASTQLVVTSTLGDRNSYEGLLSLTSHEHFHLWNVKRLRPVELGPWDYTRENYTTSLWIAEGLTSYYGDLSLARAGIVDEARILEIFSGEIASLQTTPGRLVTSVERASFDTWLYLATSPRQRTNGAAISVDYYNKGEVLGILLDLEIRHRTRNARSLDDVMRLMYRRFFLDAPAATYYYKGRGYEAADFAAAVGEVAGVDITDWFRRYVSGTEELDYDRALGHAGLRLVRDARAGRAASYAIREVPAATAEQRALRRAWLTGRAARAAGGRA
jgi:predicted metalloprotease with PDZ domain